MLDGIFICVFGQDVEINLALYYAECPSKWAKDCEVMWICRQKPFSNPKGSETEIYYLTLVINVNC